MCPFFFFQFCPRFHYSSYQIIIALCIFINILNEGFLLYKIKNNRLSKILGKMRVTLNPETMGNISLGWRSDPLSKGEKTFWASKWQLRYNI